MRTPPVPGLFVTGTNTGVGKTYVAALIAADLNAQGYRVGVYKPVASGCPLRGRQLWSEDAAVLWHAAGRPGRLAAVCPQRFAEPLAPHLAAREAGRRVDRRLLRRGLGYWRERSDLILVEGAGGLLSPVTDEEYVADLAHDFGFPLIIVAANMLGVINQTLQTLVVAETHRSGLPVAGVVLNDVNPPTPADRSTATNRAELETRCRVPILAHVGWQADGFGQRVDWHALALRRP